MAEKEKNQIGERIKAALRDAEMSQASLGREMGITQAQVNYWVMGHRNPSIENLQKIATILDKPLDYFLTTKKETTKEYIHRVKVATDIKLIPVMGISSATNEKFILEEVESYIPFNKSGEKQFAIKVEGNCMEDPKDPRSSIYNGDYVIIDPEVTPTNGDVVLARISEEYSTIKRMFICDGKVELIPDNPKYRTITKKIEDVEIVGKIINIYKPPKKKRKRIIA